MKRRMVLFTAFLLALQAACGDPVVPPEDSAPPPPPPAAAAVCDVSLVEVTPSYVRFGKAVSGSAPMLREITVRNAGNTDLMLLGAAAGAPYHVSGFMGALGPGQQGILQVSLVPDAMGEYAADLVLTFDSLPAKHVELWTAVVNQIPVIPLTGPGILDAAGATYVLQNDITTDGTCFSVQAPNITLDLNGHTVVYGNAPSASPRHGVVTAATWAPGIADNPAGGLDRGLVVQNGVIRQGAGAGEHSHGIAFYQINTPGHYEIANVTVEVSGPSSANVWAVYRDHFDIHDNHFVSSVTSIANRHQIEGALVRIAELRQENPGIVHDNVLVGGPQGGILLTGRGGQVYRNDISQNSTYTNDFGIYAWSNGADVFGNSLHPLSGRGIQVWNTGAVKIWDNRIDVTELPQNAEYGGCELGGAYGIQLDEEDDGATADCVVFHNDVTARANACPGRAFRATDVGPGRNLVCGNRFVARQTGVGRAEAVSLYGVSGGLVVGSNYLNGDSANLGIDLDGGNNVIFQANILESSTPASDYATFFFRNLPASRVVVRDCQFLNATSPTSVNMLPVGSLGGYVGPAEFSVAWTLSLRVLDSAGHPVSRATIEIRDAAGTVTATGISDANGQFVHGLDQYRFFNTDTSGLEQVTNTPHTIIIGYGGSSVTRTILMDRPQALDIEL